MAEDVIFEHWNGRVIRGKRQLGRVWRPWLSSNGGFHFEMTAFFIDEAQQSFGFEWRLTWPSPETRFQGRREVRTGLDLVQLREGQIVSKRTYIKTVLVIDDQPRVMKA